MVNQGHYEADPQDEKVARRDMRDTCVYKHQTAEIETFFRQKASPAVGKFIREFKEIAGDEGASFFSVSEFGNPNYHEDTLVDGSHIDFYNARNIGIRVTMKQRLFYYHFYAMTPPNNLFSGLYCVFTKVGGKYKILQDINTVTTEELFEDIKKVFNDDKAQLK